MESSPSRNLTQQLVHDLGRAIVHGEYDVAQSLPSEAEICEQFSISRSAVREAVKMLTAKGLISSRPRQGIRVLPRDRWNLFDTDVLGWILSGKPTLQMLKHFLQLRGAIEPAAAELASTGATTTRLRNLETALARMKAAEKGLDDPLDADIEFHISILLATGNPFYVQLRSFIETALRVSIRFTNQIKGVHAADYNIHAAIFNAISAGNGAEARMHCEEIHREAIELIDSELARQEIN